MIRTLAAVLTTGALASFVLTACDVPPSPPKTAGGGQVKTVSVTPGDQEEMSAVVDMESSRANYAYRLEVLKNYYERIGNIDKMNWAAKERINLDQAQAFEWEQVPEILPPKGESLQGADEQVLAEYVVAARNDYLESLEALGDFYEQRGQSFKAELVRNTQARFDPIRMYMYFLPAEIPPAELRPSEVIPRADALFEKALRLYREGKILPAVTNYSKERRALLLFSQLVREYPGSTKIALSAYYIGEIYKEYFNENVRAVHWYERAVQWDPNLTKPARFQAATVYDLRLHNKAKAVEMYRGAILYEQFNSSNVRYSYQRIRELTGEEFRPGQ